MKYGKGYDMTNNNGIGLMQFSGISNSSNYYQDCLDNSSCNSNYDESNVKNVVDKWSIKINPNLVEVNEYKARLITLDELIDNFGYEPATATSWSFYIPSDTTPDWLKVSDSWTMTSGSETGYVLQADYTVWAFGSLIEQAYTNTYHAIRPVINIKKCAISN